MAEIGSFYQQGTNRKTALVAVHSQDSGIDRETGLWAGIRVFVVKTENLERDRPLYEESLENKWPGKTGVFAPCIHQCRIRPFVGRDGVHKVTCLYSRPTLAMILQPGRGIPFVKPRSSTKRAWKPFTVKMGWNDYHSPNALISYPMGMGAATSDQTVTETVFFKKGKEYVLWPEANVAIRAAVNTADIKDVIEQAESWLGKHNKKKHDRIPMGKRHQLLFLNADIEPRAADVSVTDIIYYFAVDLDGEQGWIEERRKYRSIIRHDELDRGSDSKGYPIGSTEQMLLATGEVDFSDVDNMMKWMYPENGV